MQRIALARAFYSDKEILVLDEFTSSLDKATEDKIINTILELNKSKTIVIVSHNNTMEKIATETLSLNDISIANIILDRSIPFFPYNENSSLGSFILIDKITNSTAGAGLINFALNHANNLHWQSMYISYFCLMMI